MFLVSSWNSEKSCRDSNYHDRNIIGELIFGFYDQILTELNSCFMRDIKLKQQ